MNNQEIKQRLIDGNNQYVEDKESLQSNKELRNSLTDGQYPFAIILSNFLLNEKFSFQKWFFVITSFLGIIFIGFDPELINNIFALVLTALMAFFYAIANVASRDTNKLNIVTTNFFMASIGFVVLILLSFFFECMAG